MNPDSLFVLWHRLACYPASQTQGALRDLQEWIAQSIDADNVIWIGTARVLVDAEADADPFLGWRLRVRIPLQADPEPYQRQLAAYYTSDHYGKLTPTFYQRSHAGKREAHIGMTSRASMAGAGTFRVHRLRDTPESGWLDFAAFRRTLHYRLYYRDAGIVDRLWIGFPVTDSNESFFLIDRIQKPGHPRRRHFSAREVKLVGDALRGVAELHRRLLLGQGLLTSDKPLSPMERQILDGLLGGGTEKEIAEGTGQKPATLHKYVTALYARFGVKSRAGLMALWLDGGAKGASVWRSIHLPASLAAWSGWTALPSFASFPSL